MSDIKAEGRVGDFAFTVEIRDGRPACVAAEDEWFPLATALSSLPLEELVEAVEGRRCHRREDLGFSYAEEAPEEAPPGKVRVFFMDDELMLDRPFFDACAIEYGIVTLGLLRHAGLDASGDAGKRLLELRRRAA